MLAHYLFLLTTCRCSASLFTEKGAVMYDRIGDVSPGDVATTLAASLLVGSSKKRDDELDELIEEKRKRHEIGSRVLELLDCCTNGNHQLQDIYEGAFGVSGVSDVVRWCSNCGSVVVDENVDGRTSPGKIMRMKSPTISVMSRQGTQNTSCGA